MPKSISGRDRRLSRLRAAVRSGLYHVPAEIVAESLLRRLALDDCPTALGVTAQHR